MSGFLAGLAQLVDAPKTSGGLGGVGVNPQSTAGLQAPQGPSANTGTDPNDPMSQLIAMRSQGGPQGIAVQLSPPSLAGAGLRNGYSPTAAVSGAATPGAQPSGNLGQWIAQAEKITGVDPNQWGEDLALIAQHESGGNPNAINNWDSNAAAGHPSQGLMQTIPGTFNAYVPASLRSAGILNPVANIAAAIEYILSRYGSIDNVPGVKAVDSGGSYVGY